MTSSRQVFPGYGFIFTIFLQKIRQLLASPQGRLSYHPRGLLGQLKRHHQLQRQRKDQGVSRK